MGPPRPRREGRCSRYGQRARSVGRSKFPIGAAPSSWSAWTARPASDERSESVSTSTSGMTSEGAIGLPGVAAATGAAVRGGVVGTSVADVFWVAVSAGREKSARVTWKGVSIFLAGHPRVQGVARVRAGGVKWTACCTPLGWAEQRGFSGMFVGGRPGDGRETCRLVVDPRSRSSEAVPLTFRSSQLSVRITMKSSLSGQTGGWRDLELDGVADGLAGGSPRLMNAPAVSDARTGLRSSRWRHHPEQSCWLVLSCALCRTS